MAQLPSGNYYQDMQNLAGTLQAEAQRKKEEKENQMRQDYMLPGQADLQARAAGYALQRGGGYFRQPQQDLANLLMRQAQGQDSLSAEQLRQSTSRLQGQQQSLIAGARPQNAAMAARLGSQNISRLGSEMAGQQALAGIAERNAAAQAAGNVIGQGRGQDISSTLGFLDLGLRGNIAQQAGQMGYQGNLLQRDLKPDDPSFWDKMTDAALGTASLYLTGGAGGGGGGKTPSDIRLKTNIQSPDSRLDKLLSNVKPQAYEYRRDSGLPGGQRVGVMAQDLEKVAPEAVIDTPRGKVIDYNKMAPTLMASMAYLKKQVDEAKRLAESRKTRMEIMQEQESRVQPRRQAIERLQAEESKSLPSEIMKRSNSYIREAEQKAGAEDAKSALDIALMKDRIKEAERMGNTAEAKRLMDILNRQK